MARYRIPRLNELLCKELGRILFEEFEAPEGVLVTVLGAEAFPNLQQARVYISVMPEDKGKEVFKELKKRIYSFQQILNTRLKMRPVPKIQWILQHGISKGQRIEELLDEIKKKG